MLPDVPATPWPPCSVLLWGCDGRQAWLGSPLPVLGVGPTSAPTFGASGLHCHNICASRVRARHLRLVLCLVGAVVVWTDLLVAAKGCGVSMVVAPLCLVLVTSSAGFRQSRHPRRHCRATKVLRSVRGELLLLARLGDSMKLLNQGFCCVCRDGSSSSMQVPLLDRGILSSGDLAAKASRSVCGKVSYLRMGCLPSSQAVEQQCPPLGHGLDLWLLALFAVCCVPASGTSASLPRSLLVVSSNQMPGASIVADHPSFEASSP